MLIELLYSGILDDNGILLHGEFWETWETFRYNFLRFLGSKCSTIFFEDSFIFLFFDSCREGVSFTLNFELENWYLSKYIDGLLSTILNVNSESLESWDWIVLEMLSLLLSCIKYMSWD